MTELNSNLEVVDLFLDTFWLSVDGFPYNRLKLLLRGVHPGSHGGTGILKLLVFVNEVTQCCGELVGVTLDGTVAKVDVHQVVPKPGWLWVHLEGLGELGREGVGTEVLKLLAVGLMR